MHDMGRLADAPVRRVEPSDEKSFELQQLVKLTIDLEEQIVVNKLFIAFLSLLPQ